MILDDIVPEPGAHPELGVLIATMRDGFREWRQNLEEPPIDAVVWQPYVGGPSIGGIILHVVACEQYWLNEVALGEASDETNPAILYDRAVDQYIPSWPAPPSEPIEWYFDLLEQSRTRSIEIIRSHAEPASHHPRKDEAMTFRWIVAHLVEHDSYHGGQAVMLHEMWKRRGASA